MSTIVVRASDTALAMDEVLKRLGPDAYILSTKQKNGQVEVRASTEAPKPKAPKPAPEPVPEPVAAEPKPAFVAAPQFSANPMFEPRNDAAAKAKTFGEVLAERQRMSLEPKAVTRAEPEQRAEPKFTAAPKPRRNDVIDDVSGGLVPDPTAPLGGLPEVSLDFIGALWAELNQPSKAANGFFARLCAAILPPEGAAPAGTALRTIIVGAKGSGKSLTTARLAALMMTERPEVRPAIIAPRVQRLLAADELAAQARLMGLTVDRPLWSDFVSQRHWGDVSANRPQIIDLSDLAGITAEDIAPLVIPGATEVLVCLPTGLHPAMIQRQIRAWKAVATGVCMTRADEWTPMPEELCAVAASGLTLAMLGHGAGLLDTLVRPTRGELRRFAEDWLTPKGEAE